MVKGYKVVYNHKGYTIEAGQNGIIPDREVAEKILNHFQKRSVHRNDQLYLLECEVDKNAVPLDRRREYHGKRVWNKEFCYCDAMEPGDYVETDLVEMYRNMLPPASDSGSCFQIGEPEKEKKDKNGYMRPTYRTFTRVDSDTWEYCGSCFKGTVLES